MSRVALPPKALSFKEIMFQEQVNELVRQEDEMDPDLLLALELSRQEEEILRQQQQQEDSEKEDLKEETTSSSSSHDVDSVQIQHDADEDFAMALQLQEELNQKEERIEIASRYRSLFQDPLSKVRALSHSEFLRETIDVLHPADDSAEYDEGEGGEYEDEEEGEGEGEGTLYDGAHPDEIRQRMLSDPSSSRLPMAEFLQQKRSTRQARKGREGEEEEGAAVMVVTKHDRDINGRMNALVLQDNATGANTGDLVDASVQIPNPIFNALHRHASQADSRRVRYHGKEDRETRQQVLDPRTRIVLFKMMNAAILSEIHGVISCGKEANVFRAISCDADSGRTRHLAVKIYKTTLNEFKNRDVYITGGVAKVSRHNPRKYIALWAEREATALRRMTRAGLPCPRVVELRKHILVLDLIGTESGEPAPQLHSLHLSLPKLRLCYYQLIRLMRDLFQRCHLVHADLSEYNVLYLNSQLYLIDVAQAVDYDHPFALDFLRRDCETVNAFFRRGGIANVLTVRELFNFITDTSLSVDQEEAYLQKMIERVADRTELSPQEQTLEAIFLKTFIPRHLDQLPDPFAEIDRLKVQGHSRIFYEPLVGVSLGSDDSALAHQILQGGNDLIDHNDHEDEDDDEEDSEDENVDLEQLGDESDEDQKEEEEHDRVEQDQEPEKEMRTTKKTILTREEKRALRKAAKKIVKDKKRAQRKIQPKRAGGARTLPKDTETPSDAAEHTVEESDSGSASTAPSESLVEA